MSRTELFFYPRPENASVATKRIARFPQRMAALLRLGMEQPFLVVAPCPAQRAARTAPRLTTDSRFNREKAAA
jgi:hypothetical protein